MYGDPRKNPLLQHSKRVIIVGLSEEIKGHNVLLPRDNKVIVTQHITNIETLTEAQKAQLQRAMDVGDRAEDLEEPEAPAAAAANGGCAEGNSATRKKSGKRWTRVARGTRGASKRAEAAACQKEAAASREVVNAVFKRDPLNHGQVWSARCSGWRVARAPT